MATLTFAYIAIKGLVRILYAYNNVLSAPLILLSVSENEDSSSPRLQRQNTIGKKVMPGRTCNNVPTTLGTRLPKSKAHNFVRPPWTPDAHSCGLSSCKKKTSSPSYRERCFGRHEIVCAGYHTRLVRINSKITTSKEATENGACDSCTAEQEHKVNHRQNVFNEYCILKTLENALDTATSSPTEKTRIKLHALLKKQRSFYQDLLAWLVSMERRAEAEFTKRRIGHKGWLLLAAPSDSRGLTNEERDDLSKAFGILEIPIGVKPIASARGVLMEEAEEYDHDRESSYYFLSPFAFCFRN
ncbi:hypothetical protein DFH27DRAFT_642781 [Peziza echinospora]|nr:hypothetical protein DFH27DRAFT_642781 [Peziza echinospora]